MNQNKSKPVRTLFKYSISFQNSEIQEIKKNKYPLQMSLYTWKKRVVHTITVLRYYLDISYTFGFRPKYTWVSQTVQMVKSQSNSSKVRSLSLGPVRGCALNRRWIPTLIPHENESTYLLWWVKWNNHLFTKHHKDSVSLLSCLEILDESRQSTSKWRNARSVPLCCTSEGFGVMMFYQQFSILKNNCLSNL